MKTKIFIENEKFKLAKLNIHLRVICRKGFLIECLSVGVLGETADIKLNSRS